MAKKRVSKRSGCSSGVIQWAKYVSRSVASVSSSARSIVKNAWFDDWHARRYAANRSWLSGAGRTNPPAAS